MSDLAQRYGGHRSWTSRLFPALAILVVVALVLWTVWVVWIKSNPVISSALATWDVVDDHTTVAEVRVTLDEDVRDPSCLIRATAEDHVTVGDLTFTPVAGNNEVTIRTERMATSVDLVGCTAKGQNDPR